VVSGLGRGAVIIWAVLRDVLILLGTFVAVTLIAEIGGAANLGTAATFGEIAFAAVLVGLLTRR
jgi:hypothetical protein